jgi:hypothetical protein
VEEEARLEIGDAREARHLSDEIAMSALFVERVRRAAGGAGARRHQQRPTREDEEQARQEELSGDPTIPHPTIPHQKRR